MFALKSNHLAFALAAVAVVGQAQAAVDYETLAPRMDFTYPAGVAKTRAQVKMELAESLRAGPINNNAVDFPKVAPSPSTLTRAQVRKDAAMGAQAYGDYVVAGRVVHF
jgi:Domain of unknown function (DUF4148)